MKEASINIKATLDKHGTNENITTNKEYILKQGAGILILLVLTFLFARIFLYLTSTLLGY